MSFGNYELLMIEAEPWQTMVDAIEYLEDLLEAPCVVGS